VKKAIYSILLSVAVLSLSGQSPAVKREAGKFYSDAFVHEAAELYDWHVVENTLAKNLNATPAKCNDFFHFIFRSGEVNMNEYLDLVQDKKIDKNNALQYWLDKIPLFEKLYKEKYLPIIMHPPVASVKQGNNSTQTGGANCNNLDFTNGTTSGWTGQWNNTGNSPGAGIYGPLNVNGLNSSLMDRWGYVHELCTGGFDRNVPILTTPPAHPYALRLGNDSAYQILQNQGNNPTNLPFNHQIISNTFQVTQLNKAVSYWYAVVLCQYNPNNHPSSIQPYFKIRMYDQNGNEIMCAHYDVDALSAPTIGGFLTQPHDIYDPNFGTLTPYDFFYKDWSQVMIPLGNYLGQNVTLTFETSDCAGGGHPGYAYITADCEPMPNISISPFACGSSGSTATLTAPAGAGTYTWAGPGIVGSANNQAVTVNTAGSYTVTMTTLGNSGFTCSFSVDTVIGPPPPQPTASFSATAACANDTMFFTDLSNANGGTIVGWNWTFGDGSSSSSYNPTHIYTSGTSGALPVNYTITTSAGCTASYSTMVTIYPPPLPKFISSTVCVGNPTVFTDQSISTVSYSWNFGDGSPPVTSSNPTHTYANPGTYTAVLTGTSVNGCLGSYALPVLVNPLPVASASAPNTCLGGLTSFNNSSVFSSTGNFYWNFGDGSTLADTSHLQNPTYTYPAAGVYLVSLSLTSGTGCSANTTFTVLVSPLPSVSTTSPPPVCPGTSIPSPTLTSNPATGVVYTWSNNNTSIGLTANGNGVPPGFVAGQNPSTGNLIGLVTITPYLNGCAGPPATETITILPAPWIVQPAVELCPDMVSGQINFATIPAGMAATFTWTNTTPGNFIGLVPANGAGSIPSFTAIDPGANPLSILISVYGSYNGCVGPTASFSITANPNPKAEFTHTRACEGNNTHFTDASTVSGASLAQWNWDMDSDGIYTNVSGPSIDYVFPAAGTYTAGLEVVSSKGCKDTVWHSLLVNASPQVGLLGDVLSGCSIHTVNFTGTSSVAAPQQIVSYNWSFGNGTTWNGPGPIASSFVNTSHTLNAQYTISMQAVSDSGCIGSVVKTNYITVYPIPLAGFDWTLKDADILDPMIHFYDRSLGASGPNAWTWYFGDPFSSETDNWSILQNPEHRYSEEQEGIYLVTQWVENIYGCRDSVSEYVKINPAFTFYAPNAFTTGNDGLNNGFKGTGIGINNATYKMWIYDRWGELIFESHDLEQEWNGRVEDKPAQQDTYVWKVEFEDMSKNFHSYKGVVNLIR